MSATNVEALISAYKEKVELYKQRKAKVQAQLDLQTTNLNLVKEKIFNLGFSSIEEAEEYVKQAQLLLESKNKELDALFYKLDNEVFEEQVIEETPQVKVPDKPSTPINMFDDLFS